MFSLPGFCDDYLHYDLGISHTYDIDYVSSYSKNGSLHEGKNSFRLVCIPKYKVKTGINWNYNTFRFSLLKKGAEEISANNPYGFHEIIGTFFYGEMNDRGKFFPVYFEILKDPPWDYYLKSVNDLNDNSFALNYMKSFLDDFFVGLPLKTERKRKLSGTSWRWSTKESDPRLQGIQKYQLLDYDRFHTLKFSSTYITTRNLSFSVMQPDYTILSVNIDSIGSFDRQKKDMEKNVVIGNIKTDKYDYHWRLTIKRVE